MAIAGDLIFASVKGSLYRSFNAGLTWDKVDTTVFPQGAAAWIIPGDTLRVLAAYYVFQPQTKRLFFISSDSGNTWKEIIIDLPVEDITRFYTSNNMKGIIFAIGESFYSRDRLFRSTDYGQTWTEPYSFPASSDGADLAVGISPTTDDMYVNDDTNIGGNFFFHSRDNGVSWSSLGWGITTTFLLVDYKHPDWIYGISNKVIRSSDGGSSWVTLAEQFQGGLMTLLQDSANQNTLFLQSYRYIGQGYRSNVYVSTDRGLTWTYDSTSQQLPLVNSSYQSQQKAFYYDSDRKRLYIGTALGIYFKDMNLTSVQLMLASITPHLNVYPQPAADFVFISCQNKNQGKANMKVYNMLGEIVHEHSDWNGRSYKWNLVGNRRQKVPSGLYFIVLQGEGKVATRKLLIQQ